MLFDHKPRTVGPQPDLANLKVTDARLGDVLSVAGVGPDFSDIDFTVDRLDQVEAGSRRWVELTGSWRDRRVYLEIHNEETVETYGNFDGRRITLDELGLSEDDLSVIDSRQNPADFIDWEGKFWLYRFSREMGVFSQGTATGRGFYAWQFQEQDGGKRFLNIRKYPGEPFAGALWTKLEPTDVTVYRST
jgi:hypothetical protein